MRDTIDMAREAGIIHPEMVSNNLKAFEALVRADERTANIACIGRIAALVGDPIDQARLHEAMDAIRARGNT
jgi:hypothetical protein